MRLTRLTLLLFLIYAFNSFGQVHLDFIQNAPAVHYPAQKEGWDLVWSDEFTTVPNSNNWSQDDGKFRDEIFSDGNWSINHVANDIGPNEAIEVSLEKLDPAVTYTYPCEQNGQWVFCIDDFGFRRQRINTQESFNYGYFEARCKMPKDRGAWLSFWLYNNDNSLPLYNEIDIFENFPLNDEAREITMNLHVDDQQLILNGNYGQHEYLSAIEPHSSHYTAEDDLSEWHTYACEWGVDYIKWFLNGKLIKEVKSSNSQAIASIVDKLTLNQRIIFSVNAQLGELTQSFDKTSMVIDYVRVYKKKPELTFLSDCAGKGGIQVLATAAGDNTFTWDVTGGTYLNNGNGLATFQLNNNSTTMEICVTATDNAGHSSTECITYPSLDPGFSLGAMTCVNNNLQLSASATYQTAGSWWGIYESDANGNITNWTKLNPDQFGSQVTFQNIGLIYGDDYVVAHGVWNDCTPWTVEYKHVKAELTGFVIADPICSEDGISVTTASSHNTSSGSQWDLYEGDANGNITNWTPISTAFGLSTTFSNLDRDKWYVINHGVWGNCAGQWKAEQKAFYSPSFYLNSTIATTQGSIVSGNYVVSAGALITTPGSEWAIYESNANGDILSQIGSPIWGPSATFDASYNLDPDQYYLVTHGVWSECSNWQWSGNLIKGTTVFRVKSNSQELADEIGKVESSIKLFPNPSSGIASISFPNKTSGEVIVLDGRGKVIQKKTIYETETTNLDLTNEQSGVYFVRIRTEGQSQILKMIKE